MGGTTPTGFSASPVHRFPEHKAGGVIGDDVGGRTIRTVMEEQDDRDFSDASPGMRKKERKDFTGRGAPLSWHEVSLCEMDVRGVSPCR